MKVNAFLLFLLLTISYEDDNEDNEDNDDNDDNADAYLISDTLVTGMSWEEKEAPLCGEYS